MEWIGKHIEAVISVGILTVGQLASYFKLRHDVASLQKQSDRTEKAVDDHVISPTLHRTPDFEKAQGEIKAEMVRINQKLDRVLELMPKPR